MTESPCRIIHHGSGLEIRITEMEGFGTACAQLGVKFGSAHVQYRQNGTLHTLPKGTAHFLEHQLFENEDGDVDYKFAALGAASNAYTEYDSTVYHFRTAQHFPEALSLLLDFVQQPFFEEESVRTEREIIAQELDEYNGFLNGDGRSVIIEIINAATGLGPDTKKREVYVTNIAVKYCS